MTEELTQADIDRIDAEVCAEVNAKIAERRKNPNAARAAIRRSLPTVVRIDIPPKVWVQIDRVLYGEGVHTDDGR